jgi:hypothetical protein
MLHRKLGISLRAERVSRNILDALERVRQYFKNILEANRNIQNLAEISSKIFQHIKSKKNSGF